MEERLIETFQEYKQYAIPISIIINIIVAVLGVIPSFFVTGANLISFGFWKGTLISFVGEALGAIVAFYLYRKGFKKFSQKSLSKYPMLNRLIHAKGKKAFFLILSLRMLPFLPSSLVTLAGAVGSVSPLVFAAASIIGKIPALMVETYSVYQVKQFEWQGKIILTIIAVYMVYVIWKKR